MELFSLRLGDSLVFDQQDGEDDITDVAGLQELTLSRFVTAMKKRNEKSWDLRYLTGTRLFRYDLWSRFTRQITSYQTKETGQVGAS